MAHSPAYLLESPRDGERPRVLLLGRGRHRRIGCRRQRGGLEEGRRRLHLCGEGGGQHLDGGDAPRRRTHHELGVAAREEEHGTIISHEIWFRICKTTNTVSNCWKIHWVLWIVILTKFRARLHGDLRISFLLLLTPSAWHCLRHSRNLRPTFYIYRHIWHNRFLYCESSVFVWASSGAIANWLQTLIMVRPAHILT